MEKLKMNVSNGTQLYGRSVPLHAVYGRVANVTYYGELRKCRGWFTLFVYDVKRKTWRQRSSSEFPKIHAIIADHYAISGEFPWIVRNKTAKKREAFYAKKREQARVERWKREENRPFEDLAREACPMRLRPMINQKTTAYQLRSGEFYNSAPSAYRDKGGTDYDVMMNPKDYQRDGITHPFNKYRPQDDRPIIAKKATKTESAKEWANRQTDENLRYWVRNMDTKDTKFTPAYDELSARDAHDGYTITRR